MGADFAERASGCTITESRPLVGLLLAAKPRFRSVFPSDSLIRLLKACEWGVGSKEEEKCFQGVWSRTRSSTGDLTQIRPEFGQQPEGGPSVRAFPAMLRLIFPVVNGGIVLADTYVPNSVVIGSIRQWRSNRANRGKTTGISTTYSRIFHTTSKDGDLTASRL